MPYIDPNWNIITPRGDVIKQILEPTIEAKPWRFPPTNLQAGSRYNLDKSKYKLIFKNETENSVEIEVIEK